MKLPTVITITQIDENGDRVSSRLLIETKKQLEEAIKLDVDYNPPEGFDILDHVEE